MGRLRRLMQSAWHEPLARFAVLGLLILAADRLLGGSAGIDDANRIVVTEGRQQVLAQSFRAEHGRVPRNDELQALLDRWIDEQVLYREALALGLDQRDVIVQRQLTQKMRFLIEDKTLLADPTEAELQAWLDRHPERYGHPRTVSFEQVFLSRGKHGERLAGEAERISAQLHARPQDFVGLGDPFLVGQVVREADATQLRREFGESFAARMGSLESGSWSAPIASSFGLHLVRITGRGDFRPARLAEVGDRVRVDYRLAQREEQNRRALAELRARYRVEFEQAG